jgi:two-component system, OmpR family, sensor histidine kinase BaeS
MSGRRVAGIGQLGARLALAFVAVALAAIFVNALLSAEILGGDFNRLVKQQERGLADASALASAAAYGNMGWKHADLDSVYALADRADAGVRVWDGAGRIVGSSPNFASLPTSHARTMPVIVRGAKVGQVTTRFDPRTAGQMVRAFEARKWHSRLIAAGLAALIALVVSVAVALPITRPLEQMLEAVRARGAGRRFIRIEKPRGVGVIRELLAAYNEMSHALDERDRLQRNLVADVAHELRTPVAVLQASHEAMIDGVTEPTPENLESLREEVLRLARMVDDLQCLASAESAALQLRLVHCDMSAIVAEAADNLRETFAVAGVGFEQHLTSAMVRCDAARMREMVTNLLTNALKFTPRGGCVLVESGPLDGTRVAKVRVSDTGVGIPADELPHVTERFFRGARSLEMADGSGIGLTIVDELVRAHSGELTIASEPGVGTQVTIALPEADSAESRRLPLLRLVTGHGS